MFIGVMKELRFADTKESCFEAWKSSQMGCSDMVCVELKWCLFAVWQEWNFRSRNVQIIAFPFFKRVGLLMFTNIGFRVRNVEICAVLSINEVDLLMLRKRVFRQRKIRNVQ